MISFIPQNNCIFVTGGQGIYLISTQTLELIKFFKVGEWISSISYDYFNEYLICGTWKKILLNFRKFILIKFFLFFFVLYNLMNKKVII